LKLQLTHLCPYLFGDRYNKESKTFREAAFMHPNTRGVALKKKAFGEGGERLAYQFFEVAEDGRTVVGDPMVAKLSRYIEDDYKVSSSSKESAAAGVTSGDVDQMDPAKSEKRDAFMQIFCERQNKAMSLADQFNEKLESIPRLDSSTPRVSFLDCSVYYIPLPGSNEQLAFLVEPKLNGKFQKWNSNNGVSTVAQSLLAC
jgi:hypothetical protein